MSIQEHIDAATGRLAFQQDELIRRAVVEVMGRAWLPQDIKNRCRFERILGENWQTLLIDGEPVLMLFDVEFPGPERLDDRYVCKVSQSYKFVGRAAHLNGEGRT